MLECLTAMAALARRTRRIKFGMNVVSLAFRELVLLAKQCASIDVLSEGRLLAIYRRLAGGRDPCGFAAIGHAAVVLARLKAYVAAGVSKFILRPMAEGDSGIPAQTERLIPEVLPEVERWNRAAS